MVVKMWRIAFSISKITFLFYFLRTLLFFLYSKATTTSKSLTHLYKYIQLLNQEGNRQEEEKERHEQLVLPKKMIIFPNFAYG
jgi:hypothetical protein